MTRVTLRTEAAIKIGSGMALPIHRAPFAGAFCALRHRAKAWPRLQLRLCSTPTIRSNTMRNALMTVATVAAFVFVATGQADAQKRTGGTHAATQTTPAT